jgi:putative transposase
MARLPRLVVPEQLHHIIARGNNDQPVFRDDSDYQEFLRWLREAALQAKVAVHAFVLLPNRIQLLATPADEAGLSKMMQTVGRHYVPYFNAKYARTGSLWEGRFRATVLEAATYFIACSTLIEYQPVALAIAAEQDAYQWSSYAHHIGSGKNPLITDHPAYWALGNTPFEREAAYRRLCEMPPPADLIEKIEAATWKAWVLGSDKFKKQLEKLTPRRLHPVKRGRPPKVPSPS